MTYKRMTYKEAYDILIREHIEDRDWTQQSWEAREMLGQLIERHTPKKPIIKKYEPICPTCGVRLAVGCRCWQNSCGQAIDWSE